MEKPMTVAHQHHGLHDYFRILVKRRWAALMIFIIAVTTAAFSSFYTTPIYRATAQILIERQTPRVLDKLDTPTPYDSSKEEFTQTQYKLLGSRALVRKVIDKLELKNHPYYSNIFRGLSPKADEVKKQQVEERLVSAIVGKIMVTPIRRTNLVDISFLHNDPKFSAYLINNLAQCYLEQSLELRFATSQEAASWLDENLTKARKKLEESETALNQYKKEYHIAAVEDKESITTQKLEQLNRDLVTAQTHRMEAETRFNKLSKGQPIPQVINNSLIQTLKAQEAKIIAEASELGRKYGEEHPRIIQLNDELAATRGKIATEMGQVIQAIKNEYRMALAQEENLKAALEKQKVDTQDMSERSIKYRTLLRDVETNRALFENMLRNLKTTTSTENVPPTNIRLIYPATVPEKPYRPRKLFNMVVGTGLGLLLGISLALGLEIADPTLKTPEDVEVYLETPNLAMIPHIDFPTTNPSEDYPELIMHHEKQTLASEAYRVLRTSILFSSPGHAPQVLLLTSALPSEGKTLTAVNLAIAMAKAKGNILLIDSDLRRPDLHQIFKVPKEPGLTNYLVGEIDDLPVMQTRIPHLSLVCSGTSPPNPSELLGSPRMQDLLSKAKEQFNFIIIDSPPLMSVTDATVLATKVEGVLFVVKVETVSRRVAQVARGSLKDVKAHLLGAVLNNVNLQRDGYYYNYYYRYYSYHSPESGVKGRGTRKSRRKTKQTGSFDWVKNKFNNLKDKFYS